MSVATRNRSEMDIVENNSSPKEEVLRPASTISGGDSQTLDSEGQKSVTTKSPSEKDTVEDNSLKAEVLRRASSLSGKDTQTLDSEGFACKPLGFLLSLPFALILLVVALVGAVLYTIINLLYCFCPCFAPCIWVADVALEFALGMIAAPALVIVFVMASSPC